MRCPCARHAEHLEEEKVQAAGGDTAESKRYERVIVAAVMRSVFPSHAARRTFLKTVGAATALAALSQFFPLKSATELFAQGTGAPEKKDL